MCKVVSMNQVSKTLPDQALNRVVERFPHWHKLIEREFARSEPFRLLCEDWLACSDATLRWSSGDDPVSQQRRSEYLGLLADLEREMVHWLRCVERAEDSLLNCRSLICPPGTEKQLSKLSPDSTGQ